MGQRGKSGAGKCPPFTAEPKESVPGGDQPFCLPRERRCALGAGLVTLPQLRTQARTWAAACAVTAAGFELTLCSGCTSERGPSASGPSWAASQNLLRKR